MPIPSSDSDAREAAAHYATQLGVIGRSLGELETFVTWAASVQRRWPVAPFSPVAGVALGETSGWQQSLSLAAALPLTAAPLPTDVSTAYRAGQQRADELADESVSLVIPILGETNDDTTVAAGITLGLLYPCEPQETLGFSNLAGSNAEAHWIARCAAIRDSVWRERGAEDVMAMLTAAESPAFAWLAGLLGQAAERATAVLLDGPTATVAALLVAEFSPEAREWWFAPQHNGEAAARLAAKRLELAPCWDLSLGLGEGTGALAVWPTLQAVLAAVSENSLA